MVEKKLVGKVAVIIGATSGIGKTSAILFADEGASVVVADMDSVRAPFYFSQVLQHNNS